MTQEARKPSRATRNAWIAAIITLLVILLGRVIQFECDGPVMDEGVLLVYPEMVLDGKVPYRDFETFYGPLNLWVLAGAYSVFGVHILVERSVALAMLMATWLGVFSLTRRSGLVVGVTSMVLANVFTLVVGLVAYAWTGGVACLIWSLVLLAKPGRMRVLWAGILAAAALLYRPDLGPALLALVPLLWRLDSPMRWRFAAAFGLGLLPLAGLALVAGVKPVFENLFLYPVIYSNPGRRLPIGLAPGWVQGVFWAHFAACGINLLAAARAWFRRSENGEHALQLSAALLGLLITHQSLQRSDDIHVGMSAFLSISLVPWSIVSLLKRDNEARVWHGAVAGTAVLAIMMAVAFRPFTGFYEQARLALNGSELVALSVEHKGRNYPVSSVGAYRAVQRIVDVLDRNSKSGERLFVGPSDLRRTNYADSYLYYLSPKLKPASYFIEMNPLSANRPGSRLASDIATADWLVLDDQFNVWDEPNASVNFGSNAPNEVVRGQFRTVMTIGPFHVLRRRTAQTPPAAPLAAQ